MAQKTNPESPSDDAADKQESEKHVDRDGGERQPTDHKNPKASTKST